MALSARYHHRAAGFQSHRAAILEFEIDPAFQHVDELHFALMVVPSGRLRQTGIGGRHLCPHPPAGRIRDAEITVFKEGAPAVDVFGIG